MLEVSKEIVKNAVISDKLKNNEILQDLYFNHVSRIPLIRGVKKSKYYYFSQDLMKIISLIDTFALENKKNELKEVDFNPYSTRLIKTNNKINDIFDGTLDNTDIARIKSAIHESYNHYIEAVMIARIIEREERIIFITTVFSILIPIATIILGIVSLIFTLINLFEKK